MAEQTAFRGVINFLGDIGVYDVILPMLLVFTIIFAILEKTKILGTEKIDNVSVGKKNINAMVAISIAFLVVASTKLVGIINQAMANIVLLVLLSVSFLLLVGVFFKDEELDFATKEGTWKTVMIVIMFIGLVVIFLDALGWLQQIFDAVKSWPNGWIVDALFFAITAGFIYLIVREPSSTSSEST